MTFGELAVALGREGIPVSQNRIQSALRHKFIKQPQTDGSGRRNYGQTHVDGLDRTWEPPKAESPFIAGVTSMACV